MRHTISSFRHSLFTFCSHPVHLRRPRYLRMNVSGSIALALLLALTTPALASAQPFDIAQGGPAARQISFADVAAAVVQSNFQLRAAALNVAIAQAQLAQAQGGQMPQATLSGSYTRTQEPPPAFLLNPNIYAAGVAISYPLSTGGRVEAQIALAQANLRGAQASFNRTKQQLVHSAEQIYLQGLLASESVAAARRALDAASESLRVARVRFSSGAAAQFDVLQAEVAIANAEQTLVQAQTGVANAAAGLNAALSLPLDTPLQLTDTLAPRPVEGTLASAVAAALRDRQDLVALQSQIAVAQAGIDLARSGGRPAVFLGAGYEFSNFSGQSPYVFGSWLATLSVTLSVFDGGITQAKVSEAQLQLDQLKIREAQTRQQIELDVRLAWLALQQATGRLTAATKAAEQGRESARLASARYTSGVGTSLELLSAQAALAQAELSLASARYDQNAARIQLILATGSL